MARRDQVQMPQSTAGLTRYFSDYKSKFEIGPGHVIVMAIVIGVIIILLHQFGPAWFGLP